MLIFQRWRRDTVCLGIGALAGMAAAVSAARSHGGPGHAVAPPPGLSPAQAACSLTSAVIDDPHDAPNARRQGKAHPAAKALSDWEQAAAAYLAADIDPAAAKALMLQLSPKGLRKLALALAARPDLPRTERALSELFMHWGEIDPLNALAQAQALPPSELSEMATRCAMRGFALGNPEQAAAYFSAPPSDEDHGELRAHSSRRGMLSFAMQMWSYQDPVAASDFLAGVPTDSFMPSTMNGIAANLAHQDPAAALNWAAHFSNPDQRKAAVLGVVSTWTQTDPQAAANYVLGAANDANRDDLVSTLVRAWSAENPADAARWMLGQPGEVQADGVEGLISQWSSRDPAGAAAWAAQLPAGTARNEAFSKVASNWLDYDPAAMESWLGGLPAGDARDAAIASYATAGRNDVDPASVLRRVQTIDDPAKRDNTLVSVLNGWLGDHPQDAHQWISQSGLPTSVLDKLTGG